jgi:hypothetical protein
MLVLTRKDFCYFGTNLQLATWVNDDYQHGVEKSHSWAMNSNLRTEGRDGGIVNITW